MLYDETLAMQRSGLHNARRCSDDVCTMDADKEQSDVVAVEEDMRREVSSILSQVQGLEVHA